MKGSEASSYAKGDEIVVCDMCYTVTHLVTAGPSRLKSIPYQQVRYTGSREIGGKKFVVPVYHERFLAEDESGERCLIDLVYERETEHVSAETLRSVFGLRQTRMQTERHY